jgi:ficolin
VNDQYSDGMMFTTSDKDQDLAGINCADYYGDGGGWWYKTCFRANLNGKYTGGSRATATAHGVIWQLWKGWSYTLKAAEMKIKPVIP